VSVLIHYLGPWLPKMPLNTPESLLNHCCLQSLGIDPWSQSGSRWSIVIQSGPRNIRRQNWLFNLFADNTYSCLQVYIHFLLCSTCYQLFIYHFLEEYLSCTLLTQTYFLNYLIRKVRYFTPTYWFRRYSHQPNHFSRRAVLHQKRSKKAIFMPR
jgi:hypothetical protein